MCSEGYVRMRQLRGCWCSGSQLKLGCLGQPRIFTSNLKLRGCRMDARSRANSECYDVLYMIAAPEIPQVRWKCKHPTSCFLLRSNAFRSIVSRAIRPSRFAQISSQGFSRFGSLILIRPFSISLSVMAQNLGTQDHPIATLDVIGVYSPVAEE